MSNGWYLLPKRACGDFVGSLANYGEVIGPVTLGLDEEYVHEMINHAEA